MGVVIGTAAYMAPEQARGKSVDTRADVWGFGTVLYEMLANARAFEGETVSDTIAAVLTKDPDWSKVRPDAPRLLIDLAKRCLRKDPRRRPQAIGDVRLALEDAGADDLLPGLTMVRPPAWRPWAVAALALVAGVAAGSIFTGGSPRTSCERRGQCPCRSRQTCLCRSRRRLRLRCRATARCSRSSVGSGNARKLYVRRIDATTATPIAGTDGASGPFFSPDGQWLAFVSDVSLRKVRILGQQPAGPTDLSGRQRRSVDRRRHDYLRADTSGPVVSNRGGRWRTGASDTPRRHIHAQVSDLDSREARGAVHGQERGRWKLSHSRARSSNRESDHRANRRLSAGLCGARTVTVHAGLGRS